MTRRAARPFSRHFGLLPLLLLALSCNADVDLGQKPGPDSGRDACGAGPGCSSDSAPPLDSHADGNTSQDAVAHDQGPSADTTLPEDSHVGDQSLVDQTVWPDWGGTCLPPPPCNWCNGTPVLDGKGCVVAYRCANGVNPCTTQPCGGTAPVCIPGEICRADGLCWPVSSDGGTPDGSGSFGCGASSLCSFLEYCLQSTPGPCGGTLLPDAGSCPPSCQLVVCPTTSHVECICDTFACVSLPSGCGTCGCMNLPSGCTCLTGRSGGVVVHCVTP